MTQSSWYRRRNDRQLRYAGRVLPTNRAVAITIDPGYAETYAGQVCAIVSANLLARMTPSLVLDIPDVALVTPLPWAGTSLRDHVASVVRSADPHSNLETRRPNDADYPLYLGRGATRNCVHGSGWQAWLGTGASPVPDSDDVNPVGPSLAAIVAAARLFGLNLEADLGGPCLFNAFNWSHQHSGSSPDLRLDTDLGTLWTVGAGSVGSAALYFLTLFTRDFRSVTFDMDVVKVENLDRSPIFTYGDAERGTHKSDAVTSYLRANGVTDAESERDPLDESPRWSSRPAGTPDLLIAAANERNVRYVIEQSCPPLQIYGTTGTNWGASVMRHVPFSDACSCCIFPPETPAAPMVCGTGQSPMSPAEARVDAALPFLSFGAGLMTAAEILKATLPGYPFSPARATLSMWPSIDPRLTTFTPPQRHGCTCCERSAAVHRRMILGSKYDHLSSW